MTADKKLEELLDRTGKYASQRSRGINYTTL